MFVLKLTFFYSFLSSHLRIKCVIDIPLFLQGVVNRARLKIQAHLGDRRRRRRLQRLKSCLQATVGCSQRPGHPGCPGRPGERVRAVHQEVGSWSFRCLKGTVHPQNKVTYFSLYPDSFGASYLVSEISNVEISAFSQIHWL